MSGSSSWRQRSSVRVRHTRPRAWVTMKLMASGVTYSAAMTRSPSFSRSSSSTRITSRPARSSAMISVTGDMSAPWPASAVRMEALLMVSPRISWPILTPPRATYGARPRGTSADGTRAALQCACAPCTVPHTVPHIWGTAHAHGGAICVYSVHQRQGAPALSPAPDSLERTPMTESPDTASDGRRSIQSVESGFRLLQALVEDAVPLALGDLAARAGMSSSRATPISSA